jgi:hypothetical protein
MPLHVRLADCHQDPQHSEVVMNMGTFSPHPQVGAPDTNLETSPIVGEDDGLEVEPNVPGGRCLFNGVSYAVGDFVVSGSELLRCESPGMWVREGEWRPRVGGSG